MAKILDGKIVADHIKQKVASDVAGLNKRNIEVKLAIVTAGKDLSSQSYIKQILKSAKSAGINAFTENPKKTNQSNLELIISTLAQDNSVHGIVLQSPMPKEINVAKLGELIPIEKDIDGANPKSTGFLSIGSVCFAPATAQAVMEMLRYYGVKLAGVNAVILGRSNIVGKPLAQLLLGADATVTVCHSKTKDLASHTKSAELLITAIGKANFIKPEHVAKGQIVIDVGINFDAHGKITGDTDYKQIDPIVAALSPVPGGVGPITAAVLLKHVCESAKRHL